jgi:hypothetical protein
MKRPAKSAAELEALIRYERTNGIASSAESPELLTQMVRENSGIFANFAATIAR